MEYLIFCTRHKIRFTEWLFQRPKKPCDVQPPFHPCKRGEDDEAVKIWGMGERGREGMQQRQSFASDGCRRGVFILSYFRRLITRTFRSFQVSEFYGYFSADLESNELQETLNIPKMAIHAGSAHLSVQRLVGHCRRRWVLLYPHFSEPHVRVSLRLSSH